MVLPLTCRGPSTGGAPRSTVATSAGLFIKVRWPRRAWLHATMPIETVAVDGGAMATAGIKLVQPLDTSAPCPAAEAKYFPDAL